MIKVSFQLFWEELVKRFYIFFNLVCFWQKSCHFCNLLISSTKKHGLRLFRISFYKKNTDLTNLAFSLSMLEKFSEKFVSDVLSFYDFGWLWLKSASLTICDRFQFRNAILQILKVSY